MPCAGRRVPLGCSSFMLEELLPLEMKPAPARSRRNFGCGTVRAKPKNTGASPGPGVPAVPETGAKPRASSPPPARPRPGAAHRSPGCCRQTSWAGRGLLHPGCAFRLLKSIRRTKKPGFPPRWPGEPRWSIHLASRHPPVSSVLPGVAEEGGGGAFPRQHLHGWFPGCLTRGLVAPVLAGKAAAALPCLPQPVCLGSMAGLSRSGFFGGLLGRKAPACRLWVVLAAGMEMGWCLFLIAGNLPRVSDFPGSVPPWRGLGGTGMANARSRRL